jgi:lipopolysaccharide/colanic/teichoic acid biosynthesis glycosyltransferase
MSDGCNMQKPAELNSSIGTNFPVRERQSAAFSGPGIPAWKRTLDIFLTVATLPLWIPVGLLITAFIKIVSPGPALFRQQRIGLGGKPFMCLKFRTMKVNADNRVHQAHLQRVMMSNQRTTKLDCGDARLIPGGLWLRSLGFDELPQLINVLFGEMSLVGPRPCTPFEYELYLPRHKKRCEVAPGLTGLWQVSGKNKTTFEEMIDLDLRYVNHFSIGSDLKIVLLTFPAILTLVWETKVQGRREDPEVLSGVPAIHERV